MAQRSQALEGYHYSLLTNRCCNFSRDYSELSFYGNVVANQEGESESDGGGGKRNVLVCAHRRIGRIDARQSGAGCATLRSASRFRFLSPEIKLRLGFLASHGLHLFAEWKRDIEGLRGLSQLGGPEWLLLEGVQVKILMPARGCRWNLRRHCSSLRSSARLSNAFLMSFVSQLLSDCRRSWGSSARVHRPAASAHAYGCSCVLIFARSPFLTCDIALCKSCIPLVAVSLVKTARQC